MTTQLTTAYEIMVWTLEFIPEVMPGGVRTALAKGNLDKKACHKTCDVSSQIF